MSALPERIYISLSKSEVGTASPLIADDGEGPIRKLSIQPFYLESEAVTNARFREFVAESGYKTDSENFGWSFVFVGLLPEDFPPTQAVVEAPWWRNVEGASWQAPLGPGSSIEDILDHPVTHISWNDAAAFADWAKGRLPSEAEWETAARGGLRRATYPWGEQEPDDESFMRATSGKAVFLTKTAVPMAGLPRRLPKASSPTVLGSTTCPAMSGNGAATFFGSLFVQTRKTAQ